MPEPAVATDGHSTCAACGSQLAPAVLSCPHCQALVHAPELKRLAAEAQSLEGAGQIEAAIAAWQQALPLLPRDSRQHAVIQERVRTARLGGDGRSADAAPRRATFGAPPQETGGAARWAAAGALVFAVLSKGKLLLAGFTKASTVFTMILAMGVYWAEFGLKFAVGLVLSIYVHEMGHVAALRRYGIKATAPMFIPGLGALVRLKEAPATPLQDARVGLAGPVWGLTAALVAHGVYLATGWTSWAAIAVVGAWVNLFNLLPVWQLDGGRGFRSLTTHQRWVAVIAAVALWWYFHEGLLLLIIIMGVLRALAPAPREGDPPGLLLYVFLLATLTMLCIQRVPLASIP